MVNENLACSRSFVWYTVAMIKHRILSGGVFLLLMLLLQGAGKREDNLPYVSIAREHEVYPGPEGFRIRGYEVLKILKEGPLYLYPLLGFTISGPCEYRFIRRSLVRRDPETRKLVLLSEREQDGFPYELYEEKGLSGDLPLVTFRMGRAESQMILELEWELAVSSATLRYLFHSGREFRDSIQRFTLYDPDKCRISVQGPLTRQKEKGALIWTLSGSEQLGLSWEENPEVTLSLIPRDPSEKNLPD